ncbi:MAG: hypothetical protein ACM3NW_06655, partial [Syntrophomonadaceae bacterium]
MVRVPAPPGRVPAGGNAAFGGAGAGLLNCWSCDRELEGGTLFCPRCTKIQAVARTEDYFSLLGLPRQFTIEPGELENRFRERSRKLHPDRFARA